MRRPAFVATLLLPLPFALLPLMTLFFSGGSPAASITELATVTAPVDLGTTSGQPDEPVAFHAEGPGHVGCQGGATDTIEG